MSRTTAIAESTHEATRLPLSWAMAEPLISTGLNPDAVMVCPNYSMTLGLNEVLAASPPTWRLRMFEMLP